MKYCNKVLYTPYSKSFINKYTIACVFTNGFSFIMTFFRKTEYLKFKLFDFLRIFVNCISRLPSYSSQQYTITVQLFGTFTDLPYRNWYSEDTVPLYFISTWFRFRPFSYQLFKFKHWSLAWTKAWAINWRP